MDQIQTSLNLLNNLLTESDKNVQKLYEDMRGLLSPNEKESEIKTKTVIENYKRQYNDFNDRFQILKNKLSRKSFQMFMYGKVSTGKSKIINAILGEDIFESAPDHTTSCFVKICKSSDESHHIEYREELKTNIKELHHIEYRDIKKSFNKLDKLKEEIKNLSTTNSEGQNQLKTGKLLSVYLNIPDNKILTLNTEIIDCPGSANKESTTEFIRTRGLQTDVFIYVLTTNMTEDEKNFFQYQWNNSSQPKIFFLINKWDQAYNDGDDVAERCKKRITKGLTDFLTNQIRLSQDEIENRIFFVSAKYICQKRNIGNKDSTIMDSHNEANCLEFENFENYLSEFITTFMNDKYKYENDLIQLKKNIIRDTNQFKTDFHEKIYIEDIVEFEKFLENIRTSEENQEKNITSLEKQLSKSKNELTSLVNKIKNNFNQNSIDRVEMNFNDFKFKNHKKVTKLQNKLEEIMFTEIDKYKKLTKIELEKEKVKLTDMMDKDIKLTPVKLLDWILMNITGFFRSIKNIFVGSDKNDTEATIKFEEEMKTLHSDINTFDEQTTTYMKDCIEYLKTEFGKMRTQLQLKIKSYEDFKKNTEILLK